MLLQYLSNRPFCIYGAGIVAMSVYTAIEALYNRRPLFFLISDPEGSEDEQEKSGRLNFEKTNGIPVKSLLDWKCELQKNKLHKSKQPNIAIPELYFVATPEIHHASILKSLHELQIKNENIFLFNNGFENDLMEAYYSSLENCHTIKDILLSEKAQRLTNYNTDFDDMENNAAEAKAEKLIWDNRFNENNIRDEKTEKLIGELCFAGSLYVYQAKSHMDKPLHRQYILSKVPSYIRPIQVGAALTDQIICSLQDNTGDNISEKNRNYCELTATYYAWKHSNTPYKGICHYRRIFDISDEQMQELLEAAARWDVILPYPSVHYPDISMQHTRYVKEDDWNAMLQALGELAPEYLKVYEESVSLRERFFLNYNMLIAKSEVFDDYCSFLFKILERTEELTTPRGWERADRYAGYLGENLTTLYFLKNRDRWKTVYAGKIWIT